MAQVLSLGPTGRREPTSPSHSLTFAYLHMVHVMPLHSQNKDNKNVIKTFKTMKSAPQVKWSMLLTFNACVSFVYSSWRHGGGGEGDACSAQTSSGVNLKHSDHFFLPFSFKIRSIPSWPAIHNVAENDFDLILLPPPPKYKDY